MGVGNKKEGNKMKRDKEKEKEERRKDDEYEIAGVEEETLRQKTKDQVYSKNERLA